MSDLALFLLLIMLAVTVGKIGPPVIEYVELRNELTELQIEELKNGNNK